MLHKLFPEQMPCLILVGHSMGGAIAVRAAHLPSLQDYIEGLAVIDVVEGTVYLTSNLLYIQLRNDRARGGHRQAYL